MKIYSFPPIANQESKILILGTMPGERSLALKQYYGHRGNQFWKLMFELFKEQFSHNYEDRTKLLLKNNIALWDVLKACIRESSSDSAIEKEESNDFSAFFKKHPNVKMIFFNGTKAANFFDQYVKDIEMPKHILPSTSPANTWATYDDKKAQWNIILKGVAQ